MCEPKPTSTLHSESASKVSTEYVTSTPVVASGTVTIRTFTTSSCLSTAQTVSSVRSSRVVSQGLSSQGSSQDASTSLFAGLIPESQHSADFTIQTTSTAPTYTPAGGYAAVQPTISVDPNPYVTGTVPAPMLVAVPTSEPAIAVEITSVKPVSTFLTIPPPEAARSYPPVDIPGAGTSVTPAGESVTEVKAIASEVYGAPSSLPSEAVVTNTVVDATNVPSALVTPPPEAQGYQANHHWQPRHFWENDDNDDNEAEVPADDSRCASWTVTTSYETVSGQPSTSWSTWTVTTTTDVVTNVPVSTLYAACSSTAKETKGSQGPYWDAKQSSSSASVSSSAEIWDQQEAWTPSSSAEVASSTDPNAGAFISDLSTSDWVPSSTNDASSIVSSTASSLQSKSSRSSSGIENTYTRLPPALSSSSASGVSQNHPAEQGNSSSSKAVSAGAAVGGIVGLLLAIAGTLAIVRWWLQRKRTKKTRMMRSSWFYGGDVREEERHDNDENEVRTEKYHSSMPVSRFSSASITPRQSRISSFAPRVAVPPFLSLGSAFRNSTNRLPSMLPSTARQSGRFPNVFQDMRKSMAVASMHRQSQYQRHTDEPETYTPSVRPTPIRTPGDALSSDLRAIRTISPDLPPVPPLPSKFERLARPPPPDSVVPASAAIASSRWTAFPPRAEEAKRPTLNWGDSYASRFIPQTAGPSEASRSSHGPTEVISSALPSSVGHSQNPGQWHHTSSLPTPSAARTSSNALHSNGNGGETTRGQSHYSQTGTVQSFYSQPEDFCLADLPEAIGRAITAPGRISVDAFDSSTYRGSIPFPEPRTKYTPSTGPPTSFPFSTTGRTLTVVSQTPSSAAASDMRRTMGPTPRLNVPIPRGRDDSVFEFASMTGGSEGRRTQYTARTRSRADTELPGDWYDKSLWDQSVPGTAGKGSSAPSSSLDKGKGKARDETDDRKSRGKSVKWGDEEEPLPEVFELARAL